MRTQDLPHEDTGAAFYLETLSEDLRHTRRPRYICANNCPFLLKVDSTTRSQELTWTAHPPEIRRTNNPTIQRMGFRGVQSLFPNFVRYKVLLLDENPQRAEPNTQPRQSLLGVCYSYLCLLELGRQVCDLS